MKIDRISSERLNLLRFPLIVGVVFIHAYGTDVGMANARIGMAQSGYLAQFIQDIVSDGLARVAVPLFFMMSGYLFFLGFEWSLDGYKRKLRKRVNTLLIPFLFWNSLALLLFAIAQSLPATRVYFSGENTPIASFGLYDYLNALLGISQSPIALQFWFIRDLMLMVLLVPVLQLILKKIPTIFLGVIALIWFFGIWPIYTPSSVAFFFYVGTSLAFSGRSLFTVDRYGNIFLCVYIAILLLDALTKGNEFNGYIHRIGILFGIVSALYVTRLVLKFNKLRSSLLWTSGCSFFVFAVHNPSLVVLRKVSYRFLKPESDMAVLALYFSVPIITIAVAIVLHVILKAVAPKLLSVISGGR